MFFVFGVLSFVLFLIAFLLLRRSPRGMFLSIDNLFVLGCSFLFGIMFPITYYYSLSHNDNAFLSVIPEYSAFDLFLYYICVCAFMLFFVITFRKTISSNAAIFKAENDYCDNRNEHIWLSAVILFFIGVVADFLYCSAYGGYLGYLQYSSYIRSGVTDVISNKWSFLIVFRKCIVIASYLFFAQIKKDGVVRIGRLLLFIVSFIMSLMVLFANKGRVSFLIYLVVLVLTEWIHKKKLGYIRLKQIITISFFGLIFLWGLLFISDIMDRASGVSMIETLINELSFCFSNFKVLISNMEGDDIRLFADIIAYPLFLLPSSLWKQIFPNTASDVMTIFVFGSKKGVGNVYGEVPIDAISLGYLQLGFIGMIFTATIAGFVTAKIYALVDKILSGKTRLVIITYISIDIILRSLLYADSYNIVQRCFPLLIFILVYLFVGRLLYGKSKYTKSN